MRLINIIYEEPDKLKKALEENAVSDMPSLLIQVFSGIPERSHVGEILEHVSELLPRATFLGATTSGEMIQGRAFEQSTVLSICEFERTRLEGTVVARDGQDSFELGQRVCESIDYRNATLLITFATGLTINGDEYAKGIESVRADLAIAGGLAGDNRQFLETLVFTGDDVISDGAVAVALQNHELEISRHYSLDWMPLGNPLEITRADQNSVATIDGAPALDVYRRYLGTDVSERIPVLGVQFPLMVQRQGNTVARACVRAESDGSLVYTGNLIEGEMVRFGLGDPNSVVKSLQATHGDLMHDRPEVIFAYSSSARKRMMRNSSSMEAHYLQAIAPTAGFFTYGEFFHLRGGNEFFNHTMTIVGLSEQNGDADNTCDVEQFDPTDTHLELRALSKLVSVTARELEHVNKSLEELATTDPLTEAYNRRKMNDLIMGEITRRKRYGRQATVIMFDLDDFKLINDQYGHDMGDVVIKAVVGSVKEMVRNTDYLGRWGGEEFLILNTETSQPEACMVAERLRKCIEERHNNDRMRVTISVGVTEIRPDDSMETLMKRADRALYHAKLSGKNRVKVEA